MKIASSLGRVFEKASRGSQTMLFRTLAHTLLSRNVTAGAYSSSPKSGPTTVILQLPGWKKKKGEGPRVAVRTTETEVGVIDIDDLRALGSTEEEFDDMSEEGEELTSR